MVIPTALAQQPWKGRYHGDTNRAGNQRYQGSGLAADHGEEHEPQHERRNHGSWLTVVDA